MKAMIANENKIERDLAAWRKQEEQTNKLFPPSVANSREFRLEKLRQLDAIYYKHAGGRNQEERMTLHMLNIERKKLEKQLFTTLLAKLVRAVLAPSKIKAATKSENHHRANNEQALRDQLAKSGFGNVNWQQVEQKMQRGQANFIVSHSAQVNADKRVEYDLSFSKDQYGHYKLDQYQAVLKSEARPEQNKKQTFVLEAGHTTTASQAFNLLEGRAVQLEYLNAMGAKQNMWAKLDFNDKDTAGNFKRREYLSHTDLEKTLEALPIREKASQAEIEKLVQGLRNGDRVAVHLIKEGKETPASLEVNPTLKNVDLYNANGKKVRLSDAVSEKKEKAPVVSLNRGKEEEQQRKTGIALNQ